MIASLISYKVIDLYSNYLGSVGPGGDGLADYVTFHAFIRILAEDSPLSIEHSLTEIMFLSY
jgi:hypothetical protein